MIAGRIQQRHDGFHSEFFRLLERQAAFAIEEFPQALVAGTAGPADDLRGNAVARLAPGAAAF